jgi:hypothetical protein
VAREYATTQFGWAEVYFDDSLDGDFGGLSELRLYVSSCDTLAEEGCDGTSVAGGGDEEALLYLERTQGGWTVTDAVGPSVMGRYGFMKGRVPSGAQGTCPIGTTQPISDDAVRDAAQAFVETANARVPAPEAVWALLDPIAHAHMEPYALWEYRFSATSVEGFETGEIEYAGSDVPNEFQATMEACGLEREHAKGAHVIFAQDPNDPASRGAVLMFVGHADGIKLWFARQD